MIFHHHDISLAGIFTKLIAVELNLQVLNEKITLNVESSNRQVMSIQKAIGKTLNRIFFNGLLLNDSSPLTPKSSLCMSNRFTIVIKKSLFLLSKVHSSVLQAKWLPTFTIHFPLPRLFFLALFHTIIIRRSQKSMPF